ncbi:phosphoadenosine phosphosulfate reductase family protein, partial [Roseibium sp. RKSG952]|uniref:phosphoadenosine phosphosulfate reductase domain-containing protein n=1 Tax=Roseibium sp. RKSG952 TaxID=2529384 RepID=UPI0012BCD549
VLQGGEDVNSFLKSSGMPINPLYSQGFSRVGCFPCIMARKDEIRNIAIRYPEEVERVREWEGIVGSVSKRGKSTFFGNGKVPGIENAGMDDVVAWSKTKRGGKEIDPESLKAPQVCSSIYGLCE